MPKIEETAKASAWLAALLVAAMYAVNYVFTAIGFAPKELFLSVPTPISPISGTVGTKIMSMLAGVLPITFDIPSIVILWISAFAIVFVGTYAVGYGLPVLMGKTRWAKVTWVVLWGAAIFYLLIVGLKMITFNQALGLFIYTIPASFVAVWIAGALNLTDKF